MPKTLENKLIDKFKDKGPFTRRELLEFYRSYEPDLNEGTFGWRIYDLKNRNIIKPLKRGHYVISYKPIYKPSISSTLGKIAKHLTKLSEIRHCVWEAAWLNEFMQHQTTNSTLFVEVEKGYEETFFFVLRDGLHRDVFLNPDEKTIDLYISGTQQPVIIKRLLTRAPLARRTKDGANFYTPTLEKILVDLFADDRLFYYVHGGELIHIYENALNKYAINFTTLFGYAKRRDKEQDISKFINNHMSHLVKDLLE